jgi:2-keto-4-pentenoate hydratase/2-oxohepta-3-ene-1,7-dioic acid hydratase in catechol pathway
VYYKGNHNSAVAPDTDVVWPDYSEEMDYELKLAAVVGKRGHDIDVEEADQYIAGYTIFYDFSARDTQFHEMDSNLGPVKREGFRERTRTVSDDR